MQTESELSTFFHVTKSCQVMVAMVLKTFYQINFEKSVLLSK